MRHVVLFMSDRSCGPNDAYLQRLGLPLLRPLVCRPALCLYDALRHHGVGHLHKSSDVGTLHIVDVTICFSAIFYALLVDGRHDVVQTLVYLLSSPTQTEGVLRHLQARRGYATSVNRLTRSEQRTFLRLLPCSPCSKPRPRRRA